MKGMGLFDTLARQALGGLFGGGAEGVDASVLMKLVSNQEQVSKAVSGFLGEMGGIEGLTERFKQAGLGDAAASWVGTGANQAIKPDQIQAALGDQLLQNLAGKMGMSAQQIVPVLAQFLPVIIDKLTPGGSLPAGTPNSGDIQSAIGGLLKSVLGGK
jgi:uncharacterized protein YidB (DUF937 family)